MIRMKSTPNPYLMQPPEKDYYDNKSALLLGFLRDSLIISDRFYVILFILLCIINIIANIINV